MTNHPALVSCLFEHAPLDQMGEVADTLAADPTIRPQLLANRWLPASTVRLMLTSMTNGTARMTAAELTTLAAHCHERDLQDLFIEQVRSINALCALVENHDLSDEQLDRIARGGAHVKGRLLGALGERRVDVRLLAELLDDPRRKPSRHRAMLLWEALGRADRTLLSDEDAIELLEGAHRWATSQSRPAPLAPLLLRGGQVLDAAITATSPQVRAAAAHCVWISSEQARELAAVHTDGEHSWLDLQRWAGHMRPGAATTRCGSGSWYGQTAVISQLTANPACPTEILQRVHDAVESQRELATGWLPGLGGTWRGDLLFRLGPDQRDAYRRCDPSGRRYWIDSSDVTVHAWFLGEEEYTGRDRLLRSINKVRYVLPDYLHDDVRERVRRRSDWDDLDDEVRAWAQGAPSTPPAKGPSRPDSRDERWLDPLRDPRDQPMHRLLYRSEAHAAAQLVGDDPQRWQLLVGLAVDHHGRFGELLEVIDALHPPARTT